MIIDVCWCQFSIWRKVSISFTRGAEKDTKLFDGQLGNFLPISP